MSVDHDEFAAVLLARKIVTAEQLVEAWRLSVTAKITLEEALLRLGHASTTAIAAARAWLPCVLLDVQVMDVPREIIDLVPTSVAREYVVLPVTLEGRTLTVAMAVLDFDVVQKLAFLLNREIRPVLAAREAILEAIDRHYAGRGEECIVDSTLAEFTDSAIDCAETEVSGKDDGVALDSDDGKDDFAIELAAEQGAEAEGTGSNLALDDADGDDACKFDEPKPTARRPVERRATVRYYHRMNPERTFPLLVILSRHEVEAFVKRGVSQAQSQAFRVDEGALVEIEPVLPGCACYPPREQVRVSAGEVSVTFWVVPQVLGRVMQARVVVRQEGDVLAEVPLDVCVVKQSLTRLIGALSLVLPFVLFVLKQNGLDFDSQKEQGFSLYAQAAGWLVAHLTPEVLTGLLLAATVGLYFWLRPRRRDVFWDVKTREPAPSPTTVAPVPVAPKVESAAAPEPVPVAPKREPANPAPVPVAPKAIAVEDLFSRAKKAFARGEDREGERLLGELLSARPLDTAGLLLLAERRERGGKYVTALVLYERALTTGKCAAKAYFRASLTAHFSGDTDRALDILKEAETDLPPEEMRGPMWYNMGCFSARLGRFPDALRYLNRAVDAGFDDLDKFRADPDLEPLRWQAGFRRLLADVAR